MKWFRTYWKGWFSFFLTPIKTRAKRTQRHLQTRTVTVSVWKSPLHTYNIVICCYFVMCTFKVNTFVLSIKRTSLSPSSVLCYMTLWDVSVEFGCYVCIYSYSKLVGVTDVIWHGFMDNVEIISEKKNVKFFYLNSSMQITSLSCYLFIFWGIS